MNIEENYEAFTTYEITRKQSEAISKLLKIEDCVVQPIEYVSPIKWHLAHTTWFFETFILKALNNYEVFDENYAFLFNSYYEAEGERLIRSNRGNLTRPTFSEITEYRTYVDDAITKLFKTTLLSVDQLQLIELGIQHEQQHQELMWYDIKYILGHNPIFPSYQDIATFSFKVANTNQEWISFSKQIVKIGHQNKGFCYDNELGVHEVLINPFEVSNRYVLNGEYLDFINDGGYTNHEYWLSEGWDWINKNSIEGPEYWYKKANTWYEYELSGLNILNVNEPVKHISFYEADAYARWKNCRLLTEFEWELASKQLSAGMLWEWTQSAYLPYPGFKIAKGAVGEYNGKFMINQKVLRGGSVASSKKHVRNTYRNFFHPHLRWMYSGIRLAR